MMRHVSRSHRVSLDWLFDRINLDPKIQIKYVDTKNQLADILAEGSFTREERNHLLRLFNIINNSMFSCSHFSQMNDPQAMSKRLIQEAKTGEDERVVAKSKPARNLVSVTIKRSPTVPSSSSSQSLGNLAANCSTLGSFSTGKLAAMDSNKIHASESPEPSHWEIGCEIEKDCHWSKFVPSQFGCLVRQCRVFGESLHIRTTETWLSKGRQNGAGQHQRNDLGIIWQCVYGGGKDYEDNLCVTKNTEFFVFRPLFSITQKLLLDQEDEIF